MAVSDVGADAQSGLRERKKRLMRQLLSDTAARMFLERGFDAVRVSDVAAACGVSEKTVFNYFPTKEALIMDQLEATGSALHRELSRPDVSPVRGSLDILARELLAAITSLEAAPDRSAAAASYRRFGEMVRATPSLRAYQSDMMDRLVEQTAVALAGRSGLDRNDPEAQIAATALVGLWRVQFRSLSRYLDGRRSPARVKRDVTNDVERAARLLEAMTARFATRKR
jgi:AcrR family transcriptional regulator